MLLLERTGFWEIDPEVKEWINSIQKERPFAISKSKKYGKMS